MTLGALAQFIRRYGQEHIFCVDRPPVARRQDDDAMPRAPTSSHATLEIVNQLGLHARAAAPLVQTASASTPR